MNIDKTTAMYDHCVKGIGIAEPDEKERKDFPVLPTMVVILGEMYKVRFISDKEPEYADATENDELEFIYGDMNEFSREIRIFELDFEDITDDEAQVHYNRVLRHEMVHAYFFESGLGDARPYTHDEVLVDWIARMIPKMAKEMKNIL